VTRNKKLGKQTLYRRLNSTLESRPYPFSDFLRSFKTSFISLRENISYVFAYGENVEICALPNIRKANEDFDEIFANDILEVNAID
jgi:hypothetical protein